MKKGKDADEINTAIKAVWKDWVYKPGLAPIPLDFSTPKFNEANDLAKAWIEAKGNVPAGADAFLQYESN